VFVDYNIKDGTNSNDGSIEYLESLNSKKITLIKDFDPSTVTEYNGESFVEKRKMFAVASKYILDNIDVVWATDADEFFNEDLIDTVEKMYGSDSELVSVDVPHKVFVYNQHNILSDNFYICPRITKHVKGDIYGHCNFQTRGKTVSVSDNHLFHYAFVDYGRCYLKLVKLYKTKEADQWLQKFRKYARNNNKFVTLTHPDKTRNLTAKPYTLDDHPNYINMERMIGRVQKKYISYSLWGDNKVYTYGMIENVLLARKIYPNWTVRVHYNDTVPKHVIEWLSNHVQLIKHTNSSKALNSMWRFEDMFIPEATVIIRDSDSRLTCREKKLVDEWLASTKDFHIIRDNPGHTVPILAGAFGVRNNCLEYLMSPNGNRSINGPRFNYMEGMDFMNKFIEVNKNNDRYLIDQIFLADYIYPYINLNCFYHTSTNGFEPWCIQTEAIDTGYVGEIIYHTPNASDIFGDAENTFERKGDY
jgi:hypothetical protein